MTTWTKLIEGGGTRFERDLLGSAASDAAPNGARARVAARLGLASPRLAPPVSVWRANLAALRRHALIVLVGGLAPLGAMRELRTSAELDEVSTRSAEPSALPQAATPSPLPAVAPQPIAGAPRAEPRALPNPRPAGLTRPITKSRLMSEVERLDAARAALDASSPQKALALLDDYDARFAGGELALEAAVLRVHALQQAGRREDALRLARRTSSLPGSERYRPEMKRLIDAAEKNGSPIVPHDIGGAR